MTGFDCWIRDSRIGEAWKRGRREDKALEMGERWMPEQDFVS